MVAHGGADGEHGHAETRTVDGLDAVKRGGRRKGEAGQAAREEQKGGEEESQQHRPGDGKAKVSEFLHNFQGNQRINDTKIT